MTLPPRLPRALGGLALLAATLGGCVSFGPKPPAYLVRLSPAAAAPAGPIGPVTAGHAVTVLTPDTPAELAVTRVPVRYGETRLAYLDDAQWADTPAKLFRDLLAETIRARTGRPTLDPGEYHLAPGVRLGGRLQAFGLDANALKVRLVYDALLTRQDGGPAEARRFEASVPVPAATAAAVDPALNQAANQVAAQVADWVGR